MPSSFVSATPVTSTASPNSRACWRPFWPVVASTTSSVSCGAPSSRPAITRRIFAQLLHQVRLRVQPAGGVDDHDVAAAARRRLDRVVRDRGRVGAPRASRRSRRRRAAPRSRAARRPPRGTCPRRRPAPSGRARTSRAASLPIVVVLPVPLTPTTRITARPLARRRACRARRAAPAISSTSACSRSSTSPALRSRSTSSAVAGTPTSARDQRLLERLPGLVVARVEAPERQPDRRCACGRASSRAGRRTGGAPPAARRTPCSSPRSSDQLRAIRARRIVGRGARPAPRRNRHSRVSHAWRFPTLRSKPGGQGRRPRGEADGARRARAAQAAASASSRGRRRETTCETPSPPIVTP